MTDPSKAAEDEEPRENEKLLSHENGSSKTDADGNGTQGAIIEKKVRSLPLMTSRSQVNHFVTKVLRPLLQKAQ